MADIELIVKIPEEEYKRLVYIDIFKLRGYIENGTPLPKGHGRLVDADELKKEYPHDTDWDYPVNTNSYVVESIDNSHTIIEADKETESVKEPCDDYDVSYCEQRDCAECKYNPGNN